MCDRVFEKFDSGQKKRRGKESKIKQESNEKFHLVNILKILSIKYFFVDLKCWYYELPAPAEDKQMVQTFVNVSNCTCHAEEFQCNSSRLCIPLRSKCDIHVDCDDASDEIGCELPLCIENQFQCNNRHCLERKFQCNGKNDCGDNSDEIHCGECS